MSFINSFFAWKKDLNMPNPGSFEQVHREARNVSLNNFMFDGAKADLAKGLSANFQVSHAFSMGSMMMPPSYNFGGIFVMGKHLLHGMVDTNGVFQGKYHLNLTEHLTNRIQAQITKQPGQSMIQVESEYLGSDYTLNWKAINPNVADGASGIYTASLLQSLGKNLSAGVEVIAQKAAQGESFETGYTVAARYATPQWISGISLQQMAALQASYFHKVADTVELGSELQMLLFGPRRDAVASVSAKFDYRQATIRTQLDTLGKVSLVYEEKLFPGFSLLLSGELDHLRNASRFGFGINLEN